MTERRKEDISAFLDGELQGGEVKQCIDRLTGDEALRAAWGRYHLIGDAIRGESLRFPRDDLAGMVRTALEKEPAIIAAPKRRVLPREWVRPAAGAAVAASVAIAAVVSFPVLVDDAPESRTPALATQAPVPISARYAEHARTRWKNLERPEVESKLNQYLVDHSEYASPGMSGVLPYASFVSYDGSR